MCENQTYTNNQWAGEEIIWKLEITLRWIKMKMHPTKMYEMPFSKPHSYHDFKKKEKEGKSKQYKTTTMTTKSFHIKLIYVLRLFIGDSLLVSVIAS